MTKKYLFLISLALQGELFANSAQNTKAHISPLSNPNASLKSGTIAIIQKLGDDKSLGYGKCIRTIHRTDSKDYDGWGPKLTGVLNLPVSEETKSLIIQKLALKTPNESVYYFGCDSLNYLLFLNNQSLSKNKPKEKPHDITTISEVPEEDILADAAESKEIYFSKNFQIIDFPTYN